MGWKREILGEARVDYSSYNLAAERAADTNANHRFPVSSDLACDPEGETEPERRSGLWFGGRS